MWISRDFTIDDHSLMAAPHQAVIVDSPAGAAPSSYNSHNEGAAQWEGEYEKAYETLKQIGKGAFGHVNLAQRKEDQLVVRLLGVGQLLMVFTGSSEVHM